MPSVSPLSQSMTITPGVSHVWQLRILVVVEIKIVRAQDFALAPAVGEVIGVGPADESRVLGRLDAMPVAENVGDPHADRFVQIELGSRDTRRGTWNSLPSHAAESMPQKT